MIKSLAQEWLAQKLMATDDGLVVGVSGGPDSMAMLHVLLAANRTLDWKLELHVAHLDHGLRGEESRADAAFVQAVADGLNLPCTVEAEDVRALAESQSISLEDASRRARYAFVHRVCLNTGIRKVAVAHHADDNAETILHRVLRGTGLRGLAGIPYSRELAGGSNIRLVRPLLGWTRAQIIEYLADEGIAYREDRTNADNVHTRNRIRNVLIPELERGFNPQVRDALLRLGEQADWLVEFLGETVQRTFESLIISRTDQVLTLNAEALVRKSRIVQTELIRLAYLSFRLSEQDLGFVNLVAALELVADPTSGKQVMLPKGMIVEKRYGQITFSLPSQEPRESIAEEIAIHVPGRTVLPVRRIAIECAIRSVGSKEIACLRQSANAMEEFVNADAVRLPLVVRARRSGERFFPLGAPGSKKLSDFLTDHKVTPADRKRVAVLCDHLGPIWVIGYRIDDRVKLTELTRRVLHLRATPLEP